MWVGSDQPNEIVRATISGFWHTDDEQLVASYLAPYFAELRSIWDSRSFHSAEDLIEGFYPTSLPSDEVVTAAEAWLDANADASAALRRMIVEGLDDTRRCLRVQAAAK